MSWNPPATTRLSSDDITNIVDGLRGPGRGQALAFLDTVHDPALLYVVACELVYRQGWDKPALGATAEAYRNFIRNY